MKLLFCTLFTLLFVHTLLAVPPSAFPDPVKVVGGTAYVVHVVDCEMPDYWINAVVWKKTMSELADSLYSYQALLTRPCSIAVLGALDYAFYPALRDSERQLTYAVTDSFGTLRSSEYLVGRDSPPVWMANQLRPQGQAFQKLLEWIEFLHENDQTPLTEYVGGKTLAFVPVRYERAEQDTFFRTFAYTHFGQEDTTVIPMSASDWLAMTFGHSPPDPIVPNSHEPQDQTVEDWYLTATNGQVHYYPDSTRWNEYEPGYEGLLCRIDSNGYAIPWQIPYTRDEILGFGSDAWRNAIVPILLAQGIDPSRGDPNQVICLVWMEDYTNEQWNNALWPSAQRAFGWFQIGSNHDADITGTGVIIHELAHAGPGFADYYVGGGGYKDYLNPMSYGVHNFDRWRTPYFAGENAALWFDIVEFINSLDQIGSRTLHPFDMIGYRNPFLPWEYVIIQCVENAGGWRGLVAPGDQESTKLLAWHVRPHRFGSVTIPMVLLAADGVTVDPSPGTQTDGYSSLGIDSVRFETWYEDSSEVWVDIESISNYPDSTTFVIDFHPSVPLFRLLSDSTVTVEVGGMWEPRFNVRNEGASMGPFECQVISSRESICPSFSLRYDDSVRTGELVQLFSDSLVEIPNDPISWGEEIKLTFDFPGTNDSCKAHLIMRKALYPLTNSFAYPVVCAVDTVSNHILICSNDTLYCFNSVGTQLWQDVPWSGHRINQLAVGDVRYGGGSKHGTIAAEVDSSRIYLYSMGGELRTSWPLTTGTVSTPSVMIADGYVWFVDGTTLRAYDENLNFPPYFGDVNPLNPLIPIFEFPEQIHPDGWCMLGNPALGDSVEGIAFAFTTGLGTRADGKFFVMDAGNNVLYPRNQTVQEDENHGYGVPIALEAVPGDGWKEVWFHQYDSLNHGGSFTFAYSLTLDSVWYREVDFGTMEVIPLAQGVTHADPSDLVARSLFGYYRPDVNLSFLNIGNTSNLLGEGRLKTFVLSMAFDTVSGGHVFAARGKEISLFLPTGYPIGSNNGIVCSWAGTDSVVGSPLVMRGATEEAILYTPVGNSNGWRFDQRVLPALETSDWCNSFGDPTNSGNHSFTTVPFEGCDGPEEPTMTISRTPTNQYLLKVTVCGHPEWIVQGYEIFSATNSEGPYDLTLYASPLREFSLTVPANDSKRFFYARVDYTEVLDGASIWGYYELPLPLP